MGDQSPRATLWMALLTAVALVLIWNRGALEPRLPNGLLVEVAGDAARPGVHLLERPTVAQAALAARAEVAAPKGGEAASGAFGVATQALVGGQQVRLQSGSATVRAAFSKPSSPIP